MKKIFAEFQWRPALRCIPESNYWGDADVDHTQIIGGDSVKLLGGIHSNYWGDVSPHPPPLRVLAPLGTMNEWCKKLTMKT